MDNNKLKIKLCESVQSVANKKNACNTNVTYMTFYHNIPPVPLRPIK